MLLGRLAKFQRACDLGISISLEMAENTNAVEENVGKPEENSIVDVPECESEEMSWARETLSDSGDETSAVNLLVPLLQLEQSGAKFKVAPKYGFTTEGNCTMVNKCLSVYFSVDTICTSHEIIVGFDEAGIDVDDIASIQRKNSSHSWVVSFLTPEAKLLSLAVKYFWATRRMELYLSRFMNARTKCRIRLSADFHAMELSCLLDATYFRLALKMAFVLLV